MPSSGVKFVVTKSLGLSWSLGCDPKPGEWLIPKDDYDEQVAENKRLREAAHALWQALGNSPAAIGEGPTPELELYKWVDDIEEITNAER